MTYLHCKFKSSVSVPQMVPFRWVKYSIILVATLAPLIKDQVLQAATVLVAMASRKKIWRLKFLQRSPIGDFCSGGKELRCSLSYLIVNTDKMKLDHVNTVFVSISFRHTFPQFTCSGCVKSWTDGYASQFDLDVRAAIRENENVHKKIDLVIFRLQDTKSTFLQP